MTLRFMWDSTKKESDSLSVDGRSSRIGVDRVSKNTLKNITYKMKQPIPEGWERQLLGYLPGFWVTTSSC